MHFAIYIGALALTGIVWQASLLLRSYRIARSIGLPILISPTSFLNPLWIISYRALPMFIPALQWLPFKLGRWAKHTYLGWEFDDKYAIHQELGPAFVICSPGGNEVVVGDPSAANNILKRKEFIKPALVYGRSSTSNYAMHPSDR